MPYKVNVIIGLTKISTTAMAGYEWERLVTHDEGSVHMIHCEIETSIWPIGIRNSAGS